MSKDSNYHTYPCKRTVKQFLSLQITVDIMWIHHIIGAIQITLDWTGTEILLFSISVHNHFKLTLYTLIPLLPAPISILMSMNTLLLSLCLSLLLPPSLSLSSSLSVCLYLSSLCLSPPSHSLSSSLSVCLSLPPLSLCLSLSPHSRDDAFFFFINSIEFSYNYKSSVTRY